MWTKSQNIAFPLCIDVVYTSYGARGLTAIKAEIDKYYQWYGVDGIFFDEVYYADCAKVSYYQNLYNHVKAKGGKPKAGKPKWSSTQGLTSPNVDWL